MIAIVIALPISYFLAQAWLNGFAERIELNWTYFAIAAIVLLIIAWLTIALQTVKAARVNIVRALKED
jgi:ABC-type antimicrobial peptide transport system permease subunit